jgi:hypothetical protein
VPGYWWLRQVIDDDAGHHDFAIEAVVDLAASDVYEKVELKVVQVTGAEH